MAESTKYPNTFPGPSAKELRAAAMHQPRADQSAIVPEDESLEVRLVNGLLLARGWSPRDVDRLMGLAEGSFGQARSKNFPGEGIRAKVERAFSCRLFSDERTWLLREACFRRYNFDPALLDKPELKAWTEKLSLQNRVPANPTHAQLIAVLLNHMSIHSKPV